jgi:hypothetical protein
LGEGDVKHVAPLLATLPVVLVAAVETQTLALLWM